MSGEKSLDEEDYLFYIKEESEEEAFEKAEKADLERNEWPEIHHWYTPEERNEP